MFLAVFTMRTFYSEYSRPTREIRVGWERGRKNEGCWERGWEHIYWDFERNRGGYSSSTHYSRYRVRPRFMVRMVIDRDSGLCPTFVFSLSLLPMRVWRDFFIFTFLFIFLFILFNKYQYTFTALCPCFSFTIHHKSKVVFSIGYSEQKWVIAAKWFCWAALLS